MDRRSFVLGAAALAGCAHTQPDSAHQLLRFAILAAGGERALHNARVLAWTGQATIHAGGQTIQIGIDTVVEPFVYARSESWLVSQGRASSRVLEIDQTGGWTTRNGERTPMPATQLANERQQFALYGLMRLLPLSDPGVSIELDQSNNPQTPYLLHVRHPLATETTLKFDDAYRLVGADNIVADPEREGAQLQQWIGFSGGIDGGRIRWPRRLSIWQAPVGGQRNASGAPFFDLTLDTFTPRKHR